MDTPSLAQVESFIKKHGTRANSTLTILGRLDKFVMAYNTDIGKELLQEDIDRHEALLFKLADGAATEDERVELKYLRNRMLRVSEKITAYIASMKKVCNNSQ